VYFKKGSVGVVVIDKERLYNWSNEIGKEKDGGGRHSHLQRSPDDWEDGQASFYQDFPDHQRLANEAFSGG